MPSDAKLAEYANRLPSVYHDVLAAFPQIDPGRRAGDGLAFQTLAMHFANTRRGYGLGDVQEACRQLAREGFIEIKDEIFAHPTDLGEELIAVVTGKPRASDSALPPLPARNW